MQRTNRSTAGDKRCRNIFEHLPNSTRCDWSADTVAIRTQRRGHFKVRRLGGAVKLEFPLFYTLHPRRYSPRTYCAASGTFFARIPGPSHISFLPVRTARFPSNTISVNGPA